MNGLHHSSISLNSMDTTEIVEKGNATFYFPTQPRPRPQVDKRVFFNDEVQYKCGCGRTGPRYLKCQCGKFFIDGIVLLEDK